MAFRKAGKNTDRASEISRFLPKFIVNPETGCWDWTAVKCQKTRRHLPYGKFRIGGHYGRMVNAHRWAYQFWVGPLPEGSVLDHTCNNPGCVNPDHLNVTTEWNNLMRGNGACARNLRKTHCVRGHRLPEPNAKGWRLCRMCRKYHDTERRRELKNGVAERQAQKHVG